VIRNALVYDGSGRDPFHGDVGILDGRIAAIGALGGAGAGREIDATGLAVSPGFVDVHSHADMSIANPAGPRIFEPLARQGVTTFVGGNCGMAMAPVSDRYRDVLLAIWDFFLGCPQDDNVKWNDFAGMLDCFESGGLLLNCGVLAPHGMIRVNVMGGNTDVASADDLAAMKRVVAECLDAGALGLSTGLQYFPGLCSDTRELTELARVVRDRHGVFTSHIRSYNSDTLRLALDELLAVGRDAEVPVQVSHLFCIPHNGTLIDRAVHKALNAAAWAYRKRPFHVPLDLVIRSQLAYLGRMARAGQAIGIDAMPTAAGFTHLLAFFPPWVFREGVEGARRRLRDPAERREIRASIENGVARWPHRGRDAWSMNFFKIMGWDSVYIMSVVSERNRHLMGKNVAQIAEERRCHPFDAACDLIVEEDGRVLVFETPTFPGDEFVEMSVEASLLDPNTSIVTDTILLGFGLPSHLFYDCYPKFLGRYARDRKLLPMAEAIRKCTSLPAEQLRLRDRGRVREGFFADLVVFDPARIASRSTPAEPARFPVGIHTVLVNGHAVVDPDGFHPAPAPGRLLRRGT
jgi:N-acyl-D-amino-acid deacylase